MLQSRRTSLFLILLLAGYGVAATAAEQPSTAQPNVSVLAPPLAMPGLDRMRSLRLYLPPSYAGSPDRRYPVIYMHDGQNLFDAATSYAGEWRVDETLNELTRTRGFEAIIVGIDNGGERRMAEMSPTSNDKIGAAEGPQYLAFIVDVVKPLIDKTYRTRPDRLNTALMGSSMGGLISHDGMLRYPAVFGRVGIFSPSYWASPTMFERAAALAPPAGTRVYRYAGGREGGDGGMVRDAQKMRDVLAKTMAAQDLSLHIEAAAEHNEAAWAAEFGHAVVWLFSDPAGR
jgi:predicted alpha/beta superfamily hydrolase